MLLGELNDRMERSTCVYAVGEDYFVVVVIGNEAKRQAFDAGNR